MQHTFSRRHLWCRGRDLLVGGAGRVRWWELLQQPPDLTITVGDQLLVVAIGVHGLSQGKQVLRPIVPHQRFGNDCLAGLNPLVAQPGQFERIPFSFQDGIHDRQTSLACDIADHVVQLQVHLIQRLLHMIDMGRGHLHQTFPVP